MAYRRRSYVSNYGPQPTKVLLHWSTKANAYSLRWMDTKHWTEMQIFITYLKSLPYGDYEYDPDNKTWFFMEKYLPHIQAMFDGLKSVNCFDVDFQEKPIGGGFVGKFVSIDKYLDTFKILSGKDIRTLDHDKAKKIYRHTCMKLHPDRGGNASDMSSLNEAWLHIETTHFKIKKEVEYSNV